MGILPKVRLNPASMGITNNNWSGGISYRSANGNFAIHCDFMGTDSSPYWEGQDSLDDEQVCGQLPVFLHQGLPPRVAHVRINGRTIEVRAPLLWGRLV